MERFQFSAYLQEKINKLPREARFELTKTVNLINELLEYRNTQEQTNKPSCHYGETSIHQMSAGINWQHYNLPEYCSLVAEAESGLIVKMNVNTFDKREIRIDIGDGYVRPDCRNVITIIPSEETNRRQALRKLRKEKGME